MPRRGRPVPTSIALLFGMALAGLSAGEAGAIPSQFRVSPGYFSPNGDGVADQVHVAWALTDSASDVLVTVVLSGVNKPDTLWHVHLGPRSVGPDSLVWGGQGDSTALLADGFYEVRLAEFTTTAPDPILVQAGVVLDTTPPDLPILDGNPDSAQLVPQRILSGTAAGADSVLFYRDAQFDTTIATDPASDGPATFSRIVILPEGTTTFAFRARDRAGNISPLTTAATCTYVNAPDILSARAAPVYFSPNADGAADSTRLNLDLDAPTTRAVVDVRAGEPPVQGVDGSTPVAHLYDGPLPAGTTPFVWDGRDSAGTPVADGPYEFRTWIVTYGTDLVPFDGPQLNLQLHLDTTPPGAPVPNPPLPATTVHRLLPIDCRSAGAESVLVVNNGTRVAEGGAHLVTDVGLVPGANVFTFQAFDSAGNYSPVAGPYTVDFQIPFGLHANERFRPNDEFVLNLDRAATEVEITLYTLRGRPVRTLFSRSVQTHYDIAWDGKDDLGQFAGDGPYVARTRVTYADGTRSEVKGAVVLVK